MSTRSPIGRYHAAVVNRLVRVLTRELGDRAIVAVQNPVELDNYSELQPDIALLEYRPDFYESGHPKPADILLIVEVGDGTMAFLVLMRYISFCMDSRIHGNDNFLLVPQNCETCYINCDREVKIPLYAENNIAFSMHMRYRLFLDSRRRGNDKFKICTSRV